MKKKINKIMHHKKKFARGTKTLLAKKLRYLGHHNILGKNKILRVLLNMLQTILEGTFLKLIDQCAQKSPGKTMEDAFLSSLSLKG